MDVLWRSALCHGFPLPDRVAELAQRRCADKMDVAFSRDTEEKVYVQHRMLEHSAELFEWLQEGAAVYICGDEKHMAHDVHHTLLEIIEKEGNMSREEAEAYLADMQQQKRYQRDVY